MHRKHRARGFTLVELMVVLSVLAILLAMATPSMTQLVATQRVRSMASDLHVALVRARSEAVKRNASVTIVPAGGNWSAGWSVKDAANPEAPPLHVYAPARGVSIATDVAQIVFTASGRTPLAAEATFLVSSAGSSLARCVRVNFTGRPYVKERSQC